jgi:ATP/maltotriose-dependent transcriptional regulator MalT
MQLVLEKIAVPSQAPRISRTRLSSILQESLNSCSSTVISGRAGSGKSMLAVDFARHCGRSVAWYKVDAPDGELQVFFQYLIHSIQQQRPNFRSEALAPFLETAERDEITLVAEAFVYELLESGGDPLLVVIEDLHHVCDSEWLVPFLQRFLPLLPREVHVLITSRTVPPAPLWRMRSKQTLSVIDEAALAFTRDEAVDLFDSYGLSPEQALIVLDHSHGRAAALAGFIAEAVEAPESRSEGYLQAEAREPVAPNKAKSLL